MSGCSCATLLQRNEILLLLDLKSACDACEFELQSLKHRHDVLPSEKQASILLPGIIMLLWRLDLTTSVCFSFRVGPPNSKESEYCMHAWIMHLFNSFFPTQPLASGLQIIDVVSSASGGGVRIQLPIVV